MLNMQNKICAIIIRGPEICHTPSTKYWSRTSGVWFLNCVSLTWINLYEPPWFPSMDGFEENLQESIHLYSMNIPWIFHYIKSYPMIYNIDIYRLQANGFQDVSTLFVGYIMLHPHIPPNNSPEAAHPIPQALAGRPSEGVAPDPPSPNWSGAPMGGCLGGGETRTGTRRGNTQKNKGNFRVISRLFPGYPGYFQIIFLFPRYFKVTYLRGGLGEGVVFCEYSLDWLWLIWWWLYDWLDDDCMMIDWMVVAYFFLWDLLEVPDFKKRLRLFFRHILQQMWCGKPRCRTAQAL